MPTPEEMERITNNIIEVLLRLDKEVREYNYKTENFAKKERSGLHLYLDSNKNTRNFSITSAAIVDVIIGDLFF